jgi:chromate transporter
VLAASLAGLPAVALLLAAGFVHAVWARARHTTTTTTAIAVATVAGIALHAASTPMPVKMSALFTYFAGIGSVLFGSGYVLLPALHDDLVIRLRWISEAQLIDAIAAGQATPGPVFTTATFIGYLIGGVSGATVATVGMFLPAFLCSAASSAVLPRLRNSHAAQRFLQGVNAAAVALIGVVVVTLARQAFVGVMPIVIAIVAAALVFKGINPTIVLVGAALAGAISALF